MKLPEVPLVSVLLPCYNHAKFLIETLESINSQHYNNIEIIIVDDKSTDQSALLIKNWIKKSKFPIQFIENAKNIGLSKNLNHLLSLAKGKYLNILATDDIILPNKISDHVNILEELSDDYACCYGDTIEINEKGYVTSLSLFEKSNLKHPIPRGDVFEHVAHNFYFYIQSSTIRSESLQMIRFSFDEKYISEDWFLQLRLANEFKFIGVTEPAAKYRIVNASLTRQNWKENNHHNILNNFSLMLSSIKLKSKNVKYVNRKLKSLYFSILRTKTAPNKLVIQQFIKLLYKRPINIFDPFISYRTIKFFLKTNNNNDRPR